MANEKRLIDANDVKREIWNTDCDVYEFCEGCVTNMGISRVELDDAIGRVPTVDAVEVVHGRWEDDPDDPRFVCHECGKWFLVEDATGDMNYCPHCGGAKMDGENR